MTRAAPDAPLRAVARVNLAALERNVSTLRHRLAPGVAFGAVVKANAYGHGAAAVARSATAAGAERLAVATAGEAAELREQGIDGTILVMGALTAAELEVALAARAEVVAWTAGFVDAVARASPGAVGVHVKLDTGMGRLGTRDAADALRVAERIAAHGPGLRVAGAMTHFATADDDPEFMDAQLRCFTPFADALRARWPQMLAHAANSAATLRDPRTHLDLVRCGIALYGCDPMHEDPAHHGLEPVLELRSHLAAVKPVRPGESAGYGRRFVAERPGWLGTVPIGYGDGIRRHFTNNLDVLIAGRRHPVVGTVSMDNITVDLGPSPQAVPLDPVTLIGGDGDERLTAEELAARAATINYEILCGLTARVPRVYHRDGMPA